MFIYNTLVVGAKIIAVQCFDSVAELLLVFAERLNHKPIITESPKNATVVVGGAANFTCKILSDLHPTLFWVKGNFSQGGNASTRVQVL